ncbi:MAG TPA: S-methyl-5-thioribose-1-phosphate isomerase [Kofleriaceae bacterium]|jgi:methylthioribose-1-phosphate isomerase|nr:S-methyl-5-thioribose-1-phosphate isomerase [Kofleriaceae bacterium]
MRVDGAWRRTIELAPGGDAVVVLDQTALPHRVRWLRLAELADAARAIRDMVVRGAPLIGATAAYGVALALRAGIALDDACRTLAATRPTAVNLRWALDAMRALDAAPGDRADAALALAARICDDEVARCEAIGRHGLAVLEALARDRNRAVRVLTHCNAGWLATVDWGTALAPIYCAHDAGIPVEVWVDETRPRNQGLLTAWELAQHGVPHTVIADNAGGHLMQRGQVDACIVGTDRTTAAGDVCNKIGTYLKALAAHDTGVPFYVAAPSPSIDWTIARGADIPIEERAAAEVRRIGGLCAGEPAELELIGAATPVANPAFDVTPARLVTALITERGSCAASPAGLRALFPEQAPGADRA